MMEIVEKKIIEASNSQVQVRGVITADQLIFYPSEMLKMEMLRLPYSNSFWEQQRYGSQSIIFIVVFQNVPTIDCAVGVMECCYSLEGRDESSDECLGMTDGREERQREKGLIVGGWCLKYLQKEWTNEDGKIQKGTVFKNSVRRLFESVIHFRPRFIFIFSSTQMSKFHN